MSQKIVIIVTHGPDNQEKATLPFVMATAAQAMDVEVTIILQSAGVLLAKKGGCIENIHAPGLMPLKELLDTFLSLNGNLLLCTPCVKERAIKEDQLIDGSKLIAAGTVITETLSADAVLTY
ncbi:MAG: DsrE family protein [Tenuifilum sp.]|uniref:DsrE family protein n=1 Tax=Tenuifilum sp. TaxID=2760880 RepID=UPI001B412DB1|nr:DsrE family protein [Bacteroidales bacterium]HOK60130.1 DsrE family protein [Tenuifilum sp.]MBP9029605.1 DsrE family protein [Bacteroidales bacterium]HOK85601.1 DsrE family protein [Tenuifilum sp.]HOU74485.1 DsrE family protein [Tenuifilum sp.]